MPGARRAAGGQHAVRTSVLAGAASQAWYPVQQELLDRRLRPTRAALSDERRAAAWATGRAAPLEQLLADAQETGRPEADVSPAAEVSAELKWLTRREREVTALVAAGLHNSEIGERLRISPNTVEAHMSNILGKLGMASRAQLAAWAVEHGLAPGG